MYGNGQNDHMLGGQGNDKIDGGQERDRIFKRVRRSEVVRLSSWVYLYNESNELY